MPYLRLDTPYTHTVDVERRPGEIYSNVMESDIDRLTVTIRELREGGIWRCTAEDPRPAAILMNDIRRGRTAERLAELARQLVAACIERLDLREDNVNLEFTQHAGDEMYHTMYGGFSDDWNTDLPDRVGGA